MTEVYPRGGGDQFRTEVMEVTPALAAEWLATRNTSNRPVTEADVRRLVATMVRGEFELTHQGVAFDVDGRLVDGQHRLRAIVESGVTVRMMVTWGLPLTARPKLDTGRTRRLSQLLQMFYGEYGAKRIVSWLHVIDLVTTHTPRQMSAEQAEALIEYHRPAVTWALRTFAAKRGGVNAPVVGALVYAHRADPARVEAFGASLASGANLAKGSPALALLSALRANPKPTGKDRRLEAVRTLAAVRLHLRGDARSVLRPSEDAVEYFVRIHAKTGGG